MVSALIPRGSRLVARMRSPGDSRSNVSAKVAHAHNFIQELPDGYDTIIGQAGHYLSVDEQYRIALARAYLHDPSIVRSTA